MLIENGSTDDDFLIFCCCGLTIPYFVVVGQWEALALLLIGISVNQLRSSPEGTTPLGLPLATVAYLYTLIFVSSLQCCDSFNHLFYIF